jgi:hypothetical protein
MVKQVSNNKLVIKKVNWDKNHVILLCLLLFCLAIIFSMNYIYIKDLRSTEKHYVDIIHTCICPFNNPTSNNNITKKIGNYYSSSNFSASTSSYFFNLVSSSLLLDA